MKTAELTAGAVIAQRPLTRREYADALRELHEVTEPFVRAQCGILALARPTWIQHPDGALEQSSDGLTDALREAMRRLAASQQEVARAVMQKLARGLLDGEEVPDL